MSKINNHDGSLPVHLEDDAIISYLDGELSDEEQTRAQKHLASCWACRSALKATQDSIEKFMSLRHETLLPRELPPTRPALDLFRRRLDSYKATTQNRATSVFTRSYWNNKFRNFNFLSKLPVSSPLTLRFAVAAAAVLIIAVLAFQIPIVTTVSAAELLRNAGEAKKSKLNGVSDPVLYQKIQVRITGENASGQAETINWETWEDTTRNRFREAVVSAGKRQFINYADKKTEVKNIPPFLSELAQALQSNNMNPQSPLSAASFAAWRDSLKQRQEEVTKAVSDDGAETLVLRTAPLGEVNFGQISEASYSVRAQDWNPVKLQLKIRKTEGAQIYELTGQTSEAVALAQLPPEVFPATQVAEVLKPSATPKESALPSPAESLSSNSTTAVNAPPEKTVNRAVASAELEIQVLEILNRAKADLGEQITAKREADGLLHVRGIVETAERKTELLSALQTVRANPAVRIEIDTVAEALAKEKQSGAKNSQAAITPQGVEIQSPTFAAEADLRAYFERQGGNVEQSVRSYAARRVAQSREAMQHLGALKKLANQFLPAELKTLKPEAREKWLSLIRSHARAFEEQGADLQRDLKPVFFAGAGGAGESPAVNSDADLVRAIQQLFEIGAANDAVIRSAFTASSGGVRMSAISSPQFWKAMKDAEALAERIQAVR